MTKECRSKAERRKKKNQKYIYKKKGKSSIKKTKGSKASN